MKDARYFWHGDWHAPWFDLTYNVVEVPGFGLVRVSRLAFGPCSLFWARY